MTNLRCERAERLAVRSMDEGITRADREFLSGHLSECEECRAFYRDAQSVLNMIREDMPDELDKAYLDSITDGLNERLNEHGRRPARSGRGIQVRAGIAALLIVAAAGYYAVRQIDPSRTEAPAVKSAVAVELYSLYGPVSEEMSNEVPTWPELPESVETDFPESDRAVVTWLEPEEGSVDPLVLAF